VIRLIRFLDFAARDRDASVHDEKPQPTISDHFAKPFFGLGVITPKATKNNCQRCFRPEVCAMRQQTNDEL